VTYLCAATRHLTANSRHFLRVNAQTLYLDKQKTPQICKTLGASGGLTSFKTKVILTMAKSDEIVCTNSYIKIFTDRLVIQSIRVVNFDDIVCIKAIPNYFRSSPYSDENDVEYFIEIILQTNNKIRLNDCEGHFIEVFKKHKIVSFNAQLTLDDIIPKFGKTKYFFASLLFELSPLKVTLWTK
jgi:hypothetical protein